MSRTVALDSKAYQALVDHAQSKGVSIGKAASDLILAGVSGQASASEPGLRCPDCESAMNFIYVGVSAGRYQLYAGCPRCK